MIFKQITEQLKSLSNLLLLLNDRQYNQKIAHLGNASIGGHTRHIIELLKCVTNGYNTGTVNYFNRERNLMIETDKLIAINEINSLSDKILQTDKQMKLLVDDTDDIPSQYVTTTYFREVVYNGEHAIHHLALIRVALREMKS